MVINLEQEASNSDLGARKRHCQGEGGPGAASDGNQKWGFMIPLCLTEGGYFDQFPLSVSLEDTQKIEELEMAQILVQGGTISTTALKKAEDAQKEVKDKV